MNSNDTIVASATGRPAGGTAGGRALIRMSGPAVALLLREIEAGGLFHRLDTCAPPADDVKAGGRGTRIARGVMQLSLDGGRLPCLVMMSHGPRSYTGEDTAELLVPANVAVVERVIARLVSMEGVRLATPGEFSARAYLNGRLTLAQAEGVAATIAARTDGELMAAERLMSGVTGRQFLGWCDELVTLLALVEAGIDFTDQEDVVPIAPARLAERLEALSAVISEQLGVTRGDEHRDGLPMVALAGQPNAGKSTLFNALLGRRRAVVSSEAGTTRDVLVERLELDDAAPGSRAVMLMDLAGLDHAASTSIDRDAQRAAHEALDGADVIVHCDPRGHFEVLPIMAGRPIIRVRTKADMPALDGSARDAISICAIDGYNVEVLQRAIADAVMATNEMSEKDVEREGAWLAPRHRRALMQTMEGLRSTLASVQGCRDARALAAPELVAGALRRSLDALGEVTGEVTPDDVIGRVFATFCVGK